MKYKNHIENFTDYSLYKILTSKPASLNSKSIGVIYFLGAISSKFITTGGKIPVSIYIKQTFNEGMKNSMNFIQKKNSSFTVAMTNYVMLLCKEPQFCCCNIMPTFKLLGCCLCSKACFFLNCCSSFALYSF